MYVLDSGEGSFWSDYFSTYMFWLSAVIESLGINSYLTSLYTSMIWGSLVLFFKESVNTQSSVLILIYYTLCKFLG
jgi:hypothetical protein